MDGRMTLMVVKPTLRCTANCAGCASRRELHRSALQERQLSFDQWRTILRDGVSLGMKSLEISGGEPTLYEHLLDLIREAKARGLRVKMNSNGSTINEQFAQKLLDAGLDAVCLSIYSHRPGVHDEFRRSKNLWNKVTQAARIFAQLRIQQPWFRLYTQTILLRENFRTLDKLIDFHYRLGSQTMTVSYLEGDFDGEYRLSEEEVLEFRREVVPRAVAFCETLDPRVRHRAVAAVASLYADDIGSPADLGRGIYWHKGECQIPSAGSLILANGDVHPCNVVEYTHEPVMGNVLEESLPEIWRSPAWNRFRKELHEKCEMCPMNIHTYFPLRYVAADRWTRRRRMLRSLPRRALRRAGRLLKLPH
jgi:MoaA/NifB/PqqE/SkfB family radical SAM enzyme